MLVRSSYTSSSCVYSVGVKIKGARVGVHSFTRMHEFVMSEPRARVFVRAPVEKMATLKIFLLFTLQNLVFCRAHLSCPSPAHVTNAREATGDPASEFSCVECDWNVGDVRADIKDIFTDEQKKFIRFRAPVINYTNRQLGLERWSGRVTWVWVAGRFHYLLHYPLNYQTLSLGTTDLVAENTEEEEIQINSTGCGTNTSCGVGFFELREVMEIEARAQGVEWEYLCVEADNAVLDIVSDYPPNQELSMLNSRNFALPDILYQWRFLKLYFSNCSPFSLACMNVTNYFCYRRHDNGRSCVVKELLSHYPKIIYLSLIFWLFLPILVFYLPSSTPVYSVRQIQGMFPTHKLPVYLGRCIQRCLCYHATLADRNGAIFIRLRRALGFILLSFLSFRFLILPAYQPFSWVVFCLFFTAVLYPNHLSVYITPEFPNSFPLFDEPYPDGMLRLRGSRTNSIEYQRLAHIMLERIYLPFDWRFWVYIGKNSFKQLRLRFVQRSHTYSPLWMCEIVVSAIVGIITLFLSVIVVSTYFIVPLPYFAKELFLAIHSGVYQHCHALWSSQTTPIVLKPFGIFLSFFHGSTQCVLLLYLILTLFSVSFLLTEVTIFTYLGASIAANTVFHYFVLIVAFGSTVYAIVHSIHKQYYSIVKNAEVLFENDSEIDYLKMLIRRRGMKVSLHKTVRDGVHLLGNSPTRYDEILYVKQDLVGYVNTELYFSVVENTQPIRRQVVLVIVKISLMLFFVILSMWTKNVYKNESIVSDIFNVAGQMAIPFIPAVLQFLSSQGQFGQKAEAQHKIDIVHAVVLYVQKKSDSL